MGSVQCHKPQLEHGSDSAVEEFIALVEQQKSICIYKMYQKVSGRYFGKVSILFE